MAFFYMLDLEGMRKTMEKKITERQLLIEVLSRLDERQILGLAEEMGRENPFGEALLQLLEEEADRFPWTQKTLGTEELKKLLKQELEVTQGYRQEFYKELIYFVDRAQKTDAQVYNEIGMNRTLWYRLRDNKNARTNKRNVLKMAVILHLDYWEMYYLVNLAGYSLLPKDDLTDRTAAFCIRHGIYEKEKIDELLIEAGEKPLFSEE
ncbi:MAG: hypothetical protein OSJ62_12360 [Lachnospiraceae bacterium]|nr:hypothetical protein [Lachnospiraceae bacterium]